MAYKAKYLRAKEKYQELLTNNDEVREELVNAAEEVKQLKEEIKMLLNTIAEADPSLIPEDSSEEELDDGKNLPPIDPDEKEYKYKYVSKDKFKDGEVEMEREDNMNYYEDRNEIYRNEAKLRQAGNNGRGRGSIEREEDSYKQKSLELMTEPNLRSPNRLSNTEVYHERQPVRPNEAYYQHDMPGYTRGYEAPMSRDPYPRDTRVDMREPMPRDITHENGMRSMNGGKYPAYQQRSNNEQLDSSPIENRYEQHHGQHGYY
ncbi:hypothetical protein K502DRAFT_147459 [Neoconidiobolus thromboides FSU 785]|nr:hypothetical protein K502DRAFT_147459 [Neoconidiobolus thromboides FSU 785]